LQTGKALLVLCDFEAGFLNVVGAVLGKRLLSLM
jgi:hypothetical protein